MAEAQPLDSPDPSTGEARWLAEVARVLKGAPLDKLTRRVLDGPEIRPLHWQGREPPPVPLPLQPGGQRSETLAFGWRIHQRHELPEPLAANRAIHDDLGNGVGAVTLAIDNTFVAGAEEPDGIVVLEPRDLATVLDGVRLDLAPVALDAGARAAEIGAMLLDFAHGTSAFAGLSLGVDPVGCLAHGLIADVEAETKAALALAARAPEAVAVLRADGRRWHDAGASDAQELAYTLATALHYLRALEAAGIAPERGHGLIEIVLAADDQIVTTLAKIRAARLLWGRLLLASGVAAPRVELRVETARRMYAGQAAQLNILRATLAAFAGACGGADAITVLPFDAAFGPADGFSRRIARNVQIILAEESNVFRTLDPAAGAWAIESATEQTVALAYAKLQAVEAEGGIVAALVAGTPQRAIGEVAAERAKAIAKRAMPITGVSEFPELAETPPARKLPDPSAFLADARARRCPARPAPVPSIPVLRPSPLGRPFAELRARAEAFRTRTGARPKVALLTLGTAAEFTERANWGQNLLAAGGIEAVTSAPLADADAAVAAFRASGAEIAVLCAADRVYGETAAAVLQALVAAGATQVYMLGRPSDEQRAAWTAAGATGFVHVGIDVVQWLGSVQAALGLERGE